MKLDETFLKPHPRTVEWWEERETCRNCAHLILEPLIQIKHGSGWKGGGWRCEAVKGGGGAFEPGKKRSNFQDASCIRAREGACGHEARLFKEKA